ncbi:hypothetical protein B4U79_04664 [Dinothrombium tinctorium]|jgi:transposase
MTTR